MAPARFAVALSLMLCTLAATAGAATYQEAAFDMSRPGAASDPSGAFRPTLGQPVLHRGHQRAVRAAPRRLTASIEGVIRPA